MIYEYTGQLVANCLCKHNCCYRGVYAAGQCTQHLTVSNFFTDGFDGILNECIHLPVTCTAADIVYEVGQHLGSFYSMKYLWMILDRIQVLFCTLYSCYRAVVCVSDDLKSRSFFFDVIVVAHPADGLFRYVTEQLAGLIYGYFDLSVFTNRCLAYMTA